ncbi:MAG: glycosyltransferase [Planctomycetota bacterium]|nr:MAG: glycosyltransferase [Planctomycetota bacterium]
MPTMSDLPEPSPTQPPGVALCLGSEALDRFRRVTQHLLVGLVDQVVSLSLVSADRRAEQLSLGPVRAVFYDPPRWPRGAQQMARLVDSLSGHPPALVHAVGRETYAVAGALAEAFEAELVVQVTSRADCDALRRRRRSSVARYVAMTQPLAAALNEQLSIPSHRVTLIRPGVSARQERMCFEAEGCTPTLLCLTDFDRLRGVETFLRAVAILRKENIPLMAFILGQGRREGAVRRRIRELHLTGEVTLAPPQGTLVQAIESADVFIRPVRDDAFHESSLFAMRTGTAVVTVRNPLYDHLHPDETAVVCGENSAESLAGGIRKLLTDRTFARELAQRGMAYARQHHSLTAMAEQTAELYRKLTFSRTTFPLQESRG